MNNKRRDLISDADTKLEMLSKKLADWREELSDLKESVEYIRDEEQEAYDNLSEKSQDGERGEVMQHAIDQLEEFCDGVGEIIETLSEKALEALGNNLDSAAGSNED